MHAYHVAYKTFHDLFLRDGSGSRDLRPDILFADSDARSFQAAFLARNQELKTTPPLLIEFDPENKCWYSLAEGVKVKNTEDIFQYIQGHDQV